METSYETALYEARHAVMSEKPEHQMEYSHWQSGSMRMEHYTRRKHYISMSMESCISMAAARCNQTHDDSLVLIAPLI